MLKYKNKIDKIKSFGDDEIIALHFEIQEEIKKEYKKRESKENFDNVINLCEMAISISELVMKAMKRNHKKECDEYLLIIGKQSPANEFFYPSHYAYTQYAVILKKRKELDKLREITEIIGKDGWRIK